jgi:hypothetical protein
MQSSCHGSSRLPSFYHVHTAISCIARTPKPPSSKVMLMILRHALPPTSIFPGIGDPIPPSSLLSESSCRCSLCTSFHPRTRSLWMLCRTQRCSACVAPGHHKRCRPQPSSPPSPPRLTPRCQGHRHCGARGRSSGSRHGWYSSIRCAARSSPSRCGCRWVL